MVTRLNVSVYWLVNHIINNHPIDFYNSHPEDPELEDYICSWTDEYYNSHKDEMHSRFVSLIVVCEERIKVYLK